MSKPCPRCGAAFKSEGVHGGTDWECGSFESAWPPKFRQAEACQMNDHERLLKQTGISQRNIRDLELILVNSQMSLMEGLIELGVATGYLEACHVKAIGDSLVIKQDANGTWQS